jgi:hypothetical protein
MRVAQTGGLSMKRLILVTILLLVGGISAQADTTVYDNMLKPPRGDDALHADTAYCDQRVGEDRNGIPTSARYKRCMRGRGWRYNRTNVVHTWTDPDTGLTCHDILGGIGSSCSNF